MQALICCNGGCDGKDKPRFEDQAFADAAFLESDGPVFRPTVGNFSRFHNAGDDHIALEERPRQEVKDEDGAFYTGQWRGNYRHGVGKMERLGIGVYEGQFFRNEASGVGTFVKLNGDSYEGQWSKNRAHGRGTYLHADGSSYHGQWIEDLKSGSGIETWIDGSKYEGDYFDGRKHGHGLYCAPDHSIYEGEFEEDFMQGEGTYRFADGRTYSGQWYESRMTGEGRMTWPDGRSYQGQYQDDRKDGIGKFLWSDGRSYSGQWQRGRQHGRGTYTDPRGRKWTGDWNRGLKVDPRGTSEASSNKGNSKAPSRVSAESTAPSSVGSPLELTPFGTPRESNGGSMPASSAISDRSLDTSETATSGAALLPSSDYRGASRSLAEERQRRESRERRDRGESEARRRWHARGVSPPKSATRKEVAPASSSARPPAERIRGGVGGSTARRSMSRGR